MYFSTSIASALVLTILATTTTVSAQGPSQDCLACAFTSAIVTSPTCDPTMLGKTLVPGEVTPAEKTCYCPLSSSDAWTQSCVASQTCTAEDAAQIFSQFSTVKELVCNETAPEPTVGPPAPTSAPATVAPSSPATSAPKPSTTSTASATASGTPKPSAPPKSGANSLLHSSSSKIIAGVAMAVVSAASLLL
ncbi:hypothetical protein FBU30_011054 [Linnemannia zychae]|nr:hypothetical protein FBU30_011054 [Linnemannia zychae]